jgi:hypothetical protein
MFNPEAIEAALFTLVCNAVSAFPFVTKSRHPKVWPNIDPKDQPALFLVPTRWVPTQPQAYGITRFELEYVVLVYTRADAAGYPPNPAGTPIIPQQLLNQAGLAIFNAVRGKPTNPTQAATWQPHGEKQTLGGLVENAWMDGAVTIQAGVLDVQCAMELPIHVVTGD